MSKSQPILRFNQVRNDSENYGDAIEGEWIPRFQAEHEDVLKAEMNLHEMEMVRLESEMRLSQLRSFSKALDDIGAFLF